MHDETGGGLGFLEEEVSGQENKKEYSDYREKRKFEEGESDNPSSPKSEERNNEAKEGSRECMYLDREPGTKNGMEEEEYKNTPETECEIDMGRDKGW